MPWYWHMIYIVISLISAVAMTTSYHGPSFILSGNPDRADSIPNSSPNCRKQ